MTLVIGGSKGDEKVVRKRVSNGIVWDWYWLLVAAGGEREERGAERKFIVWEWHFLLV